MDNRFIWIFKWWPFYIRSGLIIKGWFIYGFSFGYTNMMLPIPAEGYEMTLIRPFQKAVEGQTIKSWQKIKVKKMAFPEMEKNAEKKS